MTTLVNQKPDRQYYIDWLRIILILSVYLFHIGMVFNTWAWHVKNEEQYGGLLRYSMIFLHNWRMPLLFMLSGAGTWFALGKRTSGQYIKERFLRLFIPFIVGIFTLVPVQVYVEKIVHYDSIFNFYRHMFDGVYPGGNFSWHHLWFILYLFFIALLITPFLNLLRNARRGGFGKWCNSFFTRPVAQYLVIVPLLVSQIILRQYFDVETHAFFNDWASMAYYIIFFLAGFFLLTTGLITESLRQNRYIHLLSVFFTSVVMFSAPALFRSERVGEIISDIAAICLAWSCALAATGFARHYLNFDSRFRKIANEAIYPFYLLHQPVIVISAYFVVNLSIGVLLKVFVLMLSSFSATLVIYWFMIRPFNLMRVIFGMKHKDIITNQLSQYKLLKFTTMKTNYRNLKVYFSRRNIVTIVFILILAGYIYAQDASYARTLLRRDVTISEIWVPGIKVNTIQGTTGTLIGFYGGALFDSRYLIGISGGVNLTHPTVNYGFFGGIAQFILYPERMVHFSGQILLAWGTTKDYEDPKSGLLDNFWNISGEDFYFTEPGLNIEINLKENLVLVAGVSYRFVCRLDPDNENVRYTHLTSQDMQGVNFNLGLKFGKKSRNNSDSRSLKQ